MNVGENASQGGLVLRQGPVRRAYHAWHHGLVEEGLELEQGVQWGACYAYAHYWWLEDLERQLEVLHVGLLRSLPKGHQRHMAPHCMNNRIHSTH